MARRVGILYFEQEALFEQNCVAAKPTAEIVSTVLAAMSSSRERGADRRAWAVLERVPQYGIEPTAEMYTFVIRSLARSKDRNSAERAEDVLKDAVKKFPPGMDENGNPTGMGVDSFNVVLTAWVSNKLWSYLLTVLFFNKKCSPQRNGTNDRRKAEETMDQGEPKNYSFTWIRYTRRMEKTTMCSNQMFPVLHH
jgi:hypothetical protein